VPAEARWKQQRRRLEGSLLRSDHLCRRIVDEAAAPVRLSGLCFDDPQFHISTWFTSHAIASDRKGAAKSTAMNLKKRAI
jgi:hypothetical protein